MQRSNMKQFKIEVPASPFKKDNELTSQDLKPTQ